LKRYFDFVDGLVSQEDALKVVAKLLEERDIKLYEKSAPTTRELEKQSSSALQYRITHKSTHMTFLLFVVFVLSLFTRNLSIFTNHTISFSFFLYFSIDSDFVLR
jgi:hypothetical protein